MAKVYTYGFVNVSVGDNPGIWYEVAGDSKRFKAVPAFPFDQPVHVNSRIVASEAYDGQEYASVIHAVSTAMRGSRLSSGEEKTLKDFIHKVRTTA